MPEISKLQAVAAERGISVDELVFRTVEETGSVYKAAVALDVYPNAIRQRMRKMGYKPERRSAVIWVKESAR